MHDFDKENELFDKNFFDEQNRHVYTVSQINQEVKDLLEISFPEVWIEGEISNAKLHSSGHFYFSLKDDKSQLKAVMFGFNFMQLKFRPENGTLVRVKGVLTCFVKGGDYQVRCIYMEPKGIGALQLAYEQLKKKLKEEGLFDEERKRELPIFIKKIGIVTSATGAAIRDMISVIRRRATNIEVVIYPVMVQGEKAKFEITSAIEYLNENNKDLDVLLVGRGGGSIEDLWAFNEEIVARAIYNSRIPVISCVGHEIDFVISDFVADVRAATPSVAAELIVNIQQDLDEKIKYLDDKLLNLIIRIFEYYVHRFNGIIKSLVFKDPYFIVNKNLQNLDFIIERLHNKFKYRIDNAAYRLGLLRGKLDVLSPQNILKKGYSIVTHEDKIVRNVDALKIDDDILIKFYNGKVVCKVEKISHT